MVKLTDLRTVPASFCEYEKLAGKWEMFINEGGQLCAYLSAITYETFELICVETDPRTSLSDGGAQKYGKHQRGLSAPA